MDDGLGSDEEYDVLWMFKKKVAIATTTTT